MESEQIGYFKANKERLKEELKALAKTLDKNQLKEDMLKLDMFKKDLNTKMKALESMRYNYIKSE